MAIHPLQRPAIVFSDPKTTEKLKDLDHLIVELNKKNIPAESEQFINREFAAISSYTGLEKDYLKIVRKAKANVIQFLAKEHHIVLKNHYRNTWLAVGMGAFGVPIGVAFGLAVDNLGMLGIGLPIGMGIGVLLGSKLDKKAAKENKQLDLELKW